MSARDELALELFIGDNWKQPREQSVVDWEYFHAEGRFLCRIEHYEAMADAILAAGYVKPRVITTTEELDALPIGSVILDPIGISLHKNAFSGWRASNGAKEISAGMLRQEALPATVLHEGGTK